jgi:F0F1-type ATP synthase assembly protein I
LVGIRDPNVSEEGSESGRKKPEDIPSDEYRKLEDSARGLRSLEPKAQGKSKFSTAHSHMGAWLRYTTVGIQFVVTIVLPMGIGYWLDTVFDTLPWIMMTGFLLGAVAAFISIIRESMRIGNELQDEDNKAKAKKH